ncbi:nucleoside deaminase [Terasakiella sp. SH-1]|uniref:nucleoside deaminase n=1 Tax=Terasakiella sp. SH-1 TaxID=2560057 RepID=UPI0010736849|nr:nucleoside deaminase [Terasakiella sp. SH-1]
MDIAIKEAKKAALRGEVPIGAVIVDSQSGEILACTSNRTEEDFDPTAHAEVLAIRQAAAKVGSTRLPECDLYVTLEPCTMCATAISFARIRRLYFGAYDPKGGGVDHGACFYEQPTCHHKPEVYGGLQERECAALLTTFFQGKR